MTLSRRSAVILGLDSQDGAYLARLLLARGYQVGGTAVRPPTGLARLGIAADVALYRTIETALAAAPTEVYDVRGPGPDRAAATTDVLALLSTRAARLLSVGPGFGPDHATGLVAQARTRGMFAVTGHVFSRESRLSPGESAIARIIVAVANQTAPDTDDLASVTDCGWAPEYVDALWRMLQQQEPADVVVATGKALRGVDVAAYAAVHFKHDIAVPEVFAGPASLGDPAAARQQLGWSATTWGRDLVQTLCEGIADSGWKRDGR